MTYLVTPKVELTESEEDYGRFVAEPLERGFGITLGNALRRVLLGSLLGAAVTWVRIEGIQHEFSTIPHVKEDTTEFLLNLRNLRVRPLTQQEGKLFLEVEGQREVLAGDIRPSADFEIANPELHLLTLDSDEAKVSIEMNVSLGKGYVPGAHENGLPIGIIPVDAIFTPVNKVNYYVETTKDAEHVDYERLVLDVWTDGTISPIEAVMQSAEILREQLALFTDLLETAGPEAERLPAQGAVAPEIYEMPLEKLGLTPRVFNCLRRNKINKVGQLLELTEQDLLSLKKLGKKSVEEIQERLVEMGLQFKEKGNHET